MPGGKANGSPPGGGGGGGVTNGVFGSGGSGIVILKIQVCGPGTYISGGQCNTCSICSAGNFQSAACSISSDTICNTCVVCGGGNYMSSPCTASSNTVCIVCSTCSLGSYVSSPCTATTNNVCSTCTYCLSAFSFCTPGCGACPTSFTVTNSMLLPNAIWPNHGIVPPVWCTSSAATVIFDPSVSAALIILGPGVYTITPQIPSGALTGTSSLEIFAPTDFSSLISNGLCSMKLFSWDAGNLRLTCSLNPTGLPFVVATETYLSMWYQSYNAAPGWTVSWTTTCGMGTYSSPGGP